MLVLKEIVRPLQGVLVLSLVLLLLAGCIPFVRPTASTPPIEELTIYYSSDLMGYVEPCG